MSNLKQNLENALDAVYKPDLNSELLNILNDKTLTSEEMQKYKEFKYELENYKNEKGI